MGVRLKLNNYDKIFNSALKRIPTIINDYSESTKEDKENLNRMIYTKHGTDLLSNLPQCECGTVVGEYNVGVLCSNCNTEVQSPLDQDLESFLWFRSPKGVKALINPTVWLILTNKFVRNRFNVILWLCDTKYSPKIKAPDVITQLEHAGVKRGYNNFVENFDSIMNILFDLKVYKAKNRSMQHLRSMLHHYRDCIFSQYLPLPNRALLVVEENSMGTYVDPIIIGAVDAIRTMVGIDLPSSHHQLWVRENHTAKTIDKLAKFYNDTYTTTFAGKPGVLRKHVFGTRCYFSFRAVISSLTVPHDYRELHIPWGIGVSVFRIHLINKLFRRGYSPGQAVQFLQEHAQRYHPLLDELFQILIDETPYIGIPVIFQRNPSLARASAQALFVTRVKIDVNNPTVALSILDVVGPNADFDGDQLNGTVSIDIMTAEELNALAPHKSVFDMSRPRTISRNPSIPKPVVATIANWLEMEEPIDPVKMERMMALPSLN